jgi:hypothetical protein
VAYLDLKAKVMMVFPQSKYIVVIEPQNKNLMNQAITQTSKVYIIAISLVGIPFVFLFTLLLHLGWNFQDWILYNHQEIYDSVGEFWLFMNQFLHYNFLVIFPLSIFLSSKEKWYGYLWLVSSLAIGYNYFVWEVLFE